MIYYLIDAATSTEFIAQATIDFAEDYPGNILSIVPNDDNSQALVKVSRDSVDPCIITQLNANAEVLELIALPAWSNQRVD